MFVGDQRSLNPQLSPNFNVDGSKAEVTTMVRTKPETTKRKKHLTLSSSVNQPPLNADALLDLALDRHYSGAGASKDRQLIATGEVLQLKDRPEPEKTDQESQTLPEPGILDGAEFGWPEYRALFKDETLEDHGRFQRQLVLNLFCPLIVEDELPAVLHPKRVKDLGYDSRCGIMQMTRDFVGTERHEMMLFFRRFERALRIGKRESFDPDAAEAWEGLGRVLWGLPLKLYQFMQMDHDNADVLMDVKDSLYDTFRELLLKGAAAGPDPFRWAWSCKAQL